MILRIGNYHVDTPAEKTVRILCQKNYYADNLTGNNIHYRHVLEIFLQNTLIIKFSENLITMVTPKLKKF